MTSLVKFHASGKSFYTIAIIVFSVFLRQALAFRSTLTPRSPPKGCQSLFASQATFRRTVIYSSASDEDMARWEKMYNEGRESDMAQGTQIQEDLASRSEIRVITFDLDNTLWKTGACIQAANDALADHLSADNIAQPQRVEKVMGDLFQANKIRYSPLDENATAPVLLTQLRTDAIRSVLEEHNDFESNAASEYADNAFNVWTTARHAAIPSNLATSVIESLDRLSSLKTSLGSQVLIGAITDGNSDPRNVDSLKGYFDFCVNAEMVGAAKPDRRVYLEAAKCVFKHASFTDIKVGNLDNEEDVENAIGPYWVHIGDDFLKDVVAAKGLKMRTVWAVELIRDKLKGRGNALDKPGETRDLKDFMKDISEKKTISMAVGDDFYLADSLREEFVDAIVEEFEHVSDTLLRWHGEGATINTANGETKSETESSVVSIPEIDATSSAASNDDIVTVVLPEKVSGPNAVKARAFRLVREDCKMDVPAPSQNRDSRTMQDVMTLAQADKSSGVFAFPPEDIAALQMGKMVVMIKIGGTDLELSRDIFSSMTVEEVLGFTDENPVTLNLYMKKASDAPSFDIF